MEKKILHGILIFLVSLFLIGCGDINKEVGVNENSNNNGSENNGSENNGANDNGGNAGNIGIAFTAVEDFAFNQGRGTIYSDIYDIAYGNGKFVAVGIAGQIAYSTDGSTWTKVINTRLHDRYNIYKITFGGNKFVAVGVWPNVVSSGKITSWGSIINSSDGINWTSFNPENFDSTKISDIVYGNGKFVAVTSTGQIIYSLNGATWIPVLDSTFGSVAISGIAYGGGQFVAVSSSANKIAYSLDGITWKALITGPFNGIVYGDNNFMAWGKNIIASSPDGTTWTPLVNQSAIGIIYGAGKFVSWSGVSYSIDGGITWMQIDSKLVDGINGMAYGNGMFIAVGRGYGSGRQIAYSNKQE